jgi:hypothetical protein
MQPRAAVCAETAIATTATELGTDEHTESSSEFGREGTESRGKEPRRARGTVCTVHLRLWHGLCCRGLEDGPFNGVVRFAFHSQWSVPKARPRAGRSPTAVSGWKKV